ncbi:FtsK/SpoIIIE domain-containing protein [Pengzhenrongella sp.]|jgi:S-DNA-T family DNA segregation ATPase FtsK/SpoIIIE|uniref:FtsK/SpoIIIE domain-containing protein n=1 Tax=Pengzhenrongella sp. TaxID=2888820 RepID=UPI002F93D5C1
MMRMGGGRVIEDHGDRSPIRLNIAKVRVPLSAVIGAWLLGRIGAGLAYLARHWICTGLVVLAVVMVRNGSVRLVVAVLVVVLAGLLALWRARWPSTFTPVVAWRVRGLWRASRVYRDHWPLAMVTGGLTIRYDRAEHLPRLVAVRSTGFVDLVQVRMLPGQTVDSWADVAEGLAQTFGVNECRVRAVPGHPHHLVLWLLVRDPLVEPVAPFTTTPDDAVDLSSLPVALGEDGVVYRLRLLGAHLLIVGATGAGKGSVIWSILAALGPAIGSGLVKVIALDPKGGMELALGRAMFSRFVFGDPDTGTAFEAEFADALEDQVLVMRRRQSLSRGVTRLHTPTAAEPLIVIVIDELASLTAYVQDRDVKKRIAAALALLLSQGRAVGVTVIGSVQDPRKDVVDLRDLFPTRVGLRLTDAAQVALVFGPGARERGARCDEIPEGLPGVGYVSLDGVREPVRVRFTHLTDTDLAARATRHAPGQVARLIALPAVGAAAPTEQAIVRAVERGTGGPDQNSEEAA